MESCSSSINWLNPDYHPLPIVGNEYLLWVFGEKGRTYPVVSLWKNGHFVDDMGNLYSLKNVLAYADCSKIPRPPFDRQAPDMRHRKMNRRKWKDIL